jgi:hypothetical protein
MAFDDAVSTDRVPTSRRAVLRTGAKLAYAAPVVAASIKLAEQATGAQVSPAACLAGENCATGLGVSCDVNQQCACSQDVDGGFACAERICTSLPCSIGSDCDSGLCISVPGCCGNDDSFCAIPCGALAAGADSIPGVWQK